VEAKSFGLAQPKFWPRMATVFQSSRHRSTKRIPEFNNSNLYPARSATCGGFRAYNLSLRAGTCFCWRHILLRIVRI
jgi:hypothetical protein